MANSVFSNRCAPLQILQFENQIHDESYAERIHACACDRLGNLVRALSARGNKSTQGNVLEEDMGNDEWMDELTNSIFLLRLLIYSTDDRCKLTRLSQLELL